MLIENKTDLLNFGEGDFIRKHNTFSVLRLTREDDGTYYAEVQYLDSTNPSDSIVSVYGAEYIEQTSLGLNVRIFCAKDDRETGEPITVHWGDKIYKFPYDTMFVLCNDIEPVNLNTDFIEKLVENIDLE